MNEDIKQTLLQKAKKQSTPQETVNMYADLMQFCQRKIEILQEKHNIPFVKRAVEE